MVGSQRPVGSCSATAQCMPRVRAARPGNQRSTRGQFACLKFSEPGSGNDSDKLLKIRESQVVEPRLQSTFTFESAVRGAVESGWLATRSLRSVPSPGLIQCRVKASPGESGMKVP